VGPPRLLLLGGSQGAQRLNRLLPEAVARLRARRPALAVVHQCGARHLDESAALWDAVAGGRRGVELVAFLDDVAGAMGAATLILSRAGAMTLAEICAAGRPSLLLPLALAGAHQAENARLLERAGAAAVADDLAATPEAFADMLDELLGDPRRLAAMGAAARALARPGAAAAIADRVEALAGRRA
jgi:UDP-N-acetylglucosamine--N-acetylmuramyl-(pentapeptide) pyrophosphoryl-undecaprenol N-acetylglucosamine transferase